VEFSQRRTPGSSVGIEGTAGVICHGIDGLAPVENEEKEMACKYATRT